MPLATAASMASLTANPLPPLRLLFADGGARSLDTWRIIAQGHPHWRVDLTTSPAAARRCLDDHAVDAVVARLTALDTSMAAVLAAARATRPGLRRIAVVDRATRTHPEARQATVVLEVREPAALVAGLDTALAPPGSRPSRRPRGAGRRRRGRTDPAR